MNNFFLRQIFFLVLTFFCSTKIVSAQSSHIENPGFGPSTRYRILNDKDIKSELEQAEEQDIASQKENPQYQKSTHQNNAKVRKISSTQIEEKHAQNIQDVLTSEGFFVMTTGGTGAMSNLSYKGYAGFCIKVYVDGILCNNSTTGEFDWNSIDISSIETIEVEDVPSLTDTEFAGCVIRITTKNGGNKLSVESSVLSYQNNLFDTWNAKFRYDKSFEKFNYNFGVNVLSAQNEFERSKTLGTERFNFSNQGNVNFAWNAKLSENANFYGSNNFSYDKIKANRNKDLNTGIEKDFSTRNNFNFAYKNQDFKSDTSLFYNFSNVEYVNNYSTNFIENTTVNKIALTENILWLCDFTFSVENEFIPNNEKAIRFTEKIGAGKNFTFGEFSIEPQLIALFWQTQNPGVALLPRLSLNFYGVTIAGFREFVLPTFNQLYWPDEQYYSGNLSLTPEDGWSGFIGFRRSDFPLWAQYKVSYYGNKIRWLTQDGKMMPQNSSDGVYNVITLGSNISIFNDSVVFNADVTYTSAKLCETQKQIMWVPEWQSHVGLRLSIWKFLVNADYTFIGNRFVDNQNIEFYPAYNLLNLSMEFNINKNIQTYVKCNNVLDQRVVYHDNYFMPSRSFIFGVKIEK